MENDRTSSLKILFYLFFCYKELRHLGDQPTCAKSSLYLDSFFFYITSFLISVGTESVHTNRLFLKNFVEIRSFHQERDRNWNIFKDFTSRTSDMLTQCNLSQSLKMYMCNQNLSSPRNNIFNFTKLSRPCQLASFPTYNLNVPVLMRIFSLVCL